MRHPEPAAGGSGDACHETATLDEPSGGFQWTDEWRAALPTMRGVSVPAPPDAQAMVDKPVTLPDDFGIHAFIYAMEMEKLNAHTGGTWAYWDEARRAECVRQQALAAGDVAFWTDLCVQLAVTNIEGPASQRRGTGGHAYFYGLQWAAEVGVHQRGL